MDFRAHWLAILNNPESSALKKRLAREALNNLGHREPDGAVDEHLKLMRERMSQFDTNANQS